VLQVPVNIPWIHRPLRPKYAFTQATPKAGFLDPNFSRSTPVWPGMAFMRTTGVGYAQDQPLDVNVIPYTNNPLMSQQYTATGAETNYTLIANGVSSWGVPSGLVGQYIGGDGIDELIQVNLNAIAIWTMDPDAEFEVLAPAFDPQLAWATVDPGNGQDVLIYGRTKALTGGSFSLAGNGINPLQVFGLQGQLIFATGNAIDTAPNLTAPNYAVATISVQPVARLISVNSPQSITVGGLSVRYAGGTGWTGVPATGGIATPGQS
jgi:hypothetical protein